MEDEPPDTDPDPFKTDTPPDTLNKIRTDIHKENWEIRTPRDPQKPPSERENNGGGLGGLSDLFRKR